MIWIPFYEVMNTHQTAKINTIAGHCQTPLLLCLIFIFFSSSFTLLSEFSLRSQCPPLLAYLSLGSRIMKISFHPIDGRVNKSREIKPFRSLWLRNPPPATSLGHFSSCCPFNKHHSKAASCQDPVLCIKDLEPQGVPKAGSYVLLWCSYYFSFVYKGQMVNHLPES